MVERVAAVGDLWDEMHKRKRSLRQPMEKLRRML
jgi:hypothetical protein